MHAHAISFGFDHRQHPSSPRCWVEVDDLGRAWFSTAVEAEGFIAAAVRRRLAADVRFGGGYADDVHEFGGKLDEDIAF